MNNLKERCGQWKVKLGLFIVWPVFVLAFFPVVVLILSLALIFAWPAIWFGRVVPTEKGVKLTWR